MLRHILQDRVQRAHPYTLRGMDPRLQPGRNPRPLVLQRHRAVEDERREPRGIDLDCSLRRFAPSDKKATTN